MRSAAARTAGAAFRARAAGRGAPLRATSLACRRHAQVASRRRAAARFARCAADGPACGEGTGP